MVEVLKDITVQTLTNPYTTRTKVKDNVLASGVAERTWKHNLRDEILELAMGRFEWTGLPENMPKFYMERKLLVNGTAVIYNDELDGLFVGSGTPSNRLNHYEESIGYRVVSPVGGHYDEFTLGVDAVMVKNNSLGRADIVLIETYIDVMVKNRVTQIVNMMTMRTPYMLKVNEKTMNSVMEQYNQIVDGVMYIAVDPELDKLNDGNTIEVLNTQTPYHIDKLQEFYQDIKNELLTILGINNNPSNGKKERLVVDEANSNNQEIMASIKTRLEERKLAAERANKLFGTNIQVELSEDFYGSPDNVEEEKEDVDDSDNDD